MTMSNSNTVPTISINLKKPTIRIYKETLHMIGNPTHILLLVNPSDCSIIISPGNSSDVKAHYVAKYLNKNSKSPELYSTSLIRHLKMLCGNWHDNDSYKMYGEYFQKESIAKFKLNNAILINKCGGN